MIIYLLVMQIIFSPVLSADMDRAVMSWYGHEFHGRLTAAGEIYDMNEISVAHKYLPIGTEVIFYYKGRYEQALVTDRGPYVSGRTWDASRRLFKRLIRDDFDEGVVTIGYYLTGERVIRDTMRYNL